MELEAQSRGEEREVWNILGINGNKVKVEKPSEGRKNRKKTLTDIGKFRSRGKLYDFSVERGIFIV